MAGAIHGIAAAYLGFSVRSGPAPSAGLTSASRTASPTAHSPGTRRGHGRDRTRYEWREFGKALLAWAISCGLLLVAIALVGDGDRTEALEAWILRLTLVVAIWSLWPITHTIWPTRPKPCT